MAKEILIKTKLKSTTQAKEVAEQHFHTNDIGSAELVFRVEDMTKEELSKSDAVIFLNMTDGSFFRKESSIGEVIRVENEFRYTLKENEILHTGLSKVQLSVFSNGKWYSSHLYKFRIVNGLDKKSEIEVEIKDLPSETRREIAKLKNETNTVITDLSTQFQQVIDETTGKDVINGPEVIAARNGKSNLKTRLDDEHAQVTAQLAEKPDSNEVRKKTDAIGLDDLDGAALGIIQNGTGGVPINILSIPRPGSVTPETTNFFNLGKNLWDVKSAQVDTSVSSSGEVIAEQGRMLGVPVPVSPGEVLSNGKVVTRLIYLKEDFSFHSRNGTLPEGFFTVPSDESVRFIQFSPPSSTANSLMINRGSVPLPYEPADTKIKTEYLPNIDSLTEAEVRTLVTDQTTPAIANAIAPVQTKLTALESAVQNVSNKPNYLRIDGDGDFTFLLDIGNGEFASHRFKRDAVEDFIKKYEEGVCVLHQGAQDVERSLNYGNVNNGSMLATTTNNNYTITVGTIVTTEVDGRDIYGRFYRRYDGGMWKVSIDGTFVKNVSAKKNDTASGETFEEALATGLADITHTVTLEFIGNDPTSPATTSDGTTATTPRGWISANVTGDPTKATFRVVSVEEQATNFEKLFDLTSGFSNKEYAFEVAVDSQSSTQWFPAHNAIGTTNTGATGMQVLLVDGVEVSVTTPTAEYIRFYKAEFIQIMETKMTTDTENRAATRLIMTASEQRVYMNLEMEFLQDTFMRNGYVFQMPMLNTYLKQIKSDKVERAQADTINLGTSTYFTNKDANQFIATSDKSGKRDYYLKVQITNRSDNFKDIYLQHRSDGVLQKLYPKPYSQELIPAGRALKWEGYYEVGRVPRADVVYG